jgi:hypothetical protein
MFHEGENQLQYNFTPPPTRYQYNFDLGLHTSHCHQNQNFYESFDIRAGAVDKGLFGDPPHMHATCILQYVF